MPSYNGFTSFLITVNCNGKSNTSTFLLHYEESWYSNRYKASVINERDAGPGPLFLPSRPSWRGGTQLNEGEHLTGAKSSNSPYESFFHFYHSSLFTLTQSLLNLHNFSFVLITRFWGGTFGQIWWRWAQKHFNGLGAGASEERIYG